MPATTANLVAESVGALLRQAREESGFDVREVATRTKIPEKYIALFETNAHAELADDVYTKIYLKAYGKFLGFETSALLDHYRKERARYGIPERATYDSQPDRHPAKSVAGSLLVVTPKVMQVALVAFVAVGLLGWLGTEVKKIIAPPDIALASPKDGFVTYDRTVAIEGLTEREVALSVNGKPVSPDDAGKFRDTIDLQEGLNVITITGAKKHSKEMTVTRRVIVLPKMAAEAPPSELQIVEVLPAGVTPARATVTAPEAVGTMQAATVPTETAPPTSTEPATTAPTAIEPAPITDTPPTTDNPQGIAF